MTHILKVGLKIISAITSQQRICTGHEKYLAKNWTNFTV
jgi:hypothetical protein